MLSSRFVFLPVVFIFQVTTLALQSQSFQTHNGWDLLGATETISTLSDFSEECVSEIWAYENETGWKSYDTVKKGGELTVIEKGKGFWEKGIKACDVIVGENQANHWYQPGVHTTWQWQLSGTVNGDYEADIYDIDLFDSDSSLIEALHADRKKVICYFSAGSYENWREDQDLFQSSDYGYALDGWEGEKWLDIRSENVKTVMKSRLDLAQSKGCDGVEPDNVDGYQNSTGFTLTSDEQLAYNRFLSQEAHARGLAVGLKNDLDQVTELVEYFDFALNEECHEYDECDSLDPFIAVGKPVFIAEYADKYVNDSKERESLCQDSIERQYMTLVLPLELDDSFRYACGE